MNLSFEGEQPETKRVFLHQFIVKPEEIEEGKRMVIFSGQAIETS